ncbi:MAG: nitroreductase family protein [Pseudoramibacter sp.]
MNALFTRHSIRQYADQPVEEEKIQTLIKAAMAAPTAGNQQEWEFVVVTDPEVKKRAAAASPYAGCAAKAGVLIVPVGDPATCRFPECFDADMAAAMENILLEAVHLDLGGVWLAIAPFEDRIQNLQKALDIPKNVVPFAIASIGYPAQPKREDGRDYDFSKVHRDRY